mmetsp:Transcript_117223/g.332161  ORF Transcript_117223/g.332161 Transcript_117223/m.332161 type:complete len:168 (-) Transcript_117223:315-818(-)
MDEFKDSKHALVADVDCTAEGKELCEQHAVSGYPTIKYGGPGDLKDYGGGRDFSSLKKFAEENLGPTCGPDNLDLCDEESKAMIAKFEAMDVDELDKKIEEADAKISKINADSQKKVDKLNSQIKELRGKVEKENNAKDDKIEKENKRIGLRFMNVVVAYKKKKDEM